MHIFMIEGAPGVAKFVARGLIAEGWTVESFGCTQDGLAGLELGRCDLLLVDIPSPDGFDDVFWRKVRETCPLLPILYLLPRMTGKFGVDGDNDGLLRVMAKPFAFDDLIAQIEDMGRARPPEGSALYLEAGDIALDMSARTMSLGSEQVALTVEESKLASVLLGRPGRAVSTEHLLQEVWQRQDQPIACPVAATVETLRQKLGRRGTLIEPVCNYGYRLVASPSGSF